MKRLLGLILLFLFSCRLQKLGVQLVGEVVKYEELYRLCYIRGLEGLLIGLAEQLTKNRNP